ncbi:unnamed protein product [Eruca vesicaria subsp. sativa]|uniref:Uncharacterized protein n=1 Tax=Eruca vesicaria subsp. sativa TaxID=29727 RepID=A0ABC8LNX3_ERUVS|nr:unnamed protein product [Eruca vesicaria subsp. sativa]
MTKTMINPPWREKEGNKKPVINWDILAEFWRRQSILVVYKTSLQGVRVRRTYEYCMHVIAILKHQELVVNEMDIDFGHLSIEHAQGASPREATES